MQIRLEFRCPPSESPTLNLDLGDVFKLTEQMNASGPVVEYQAVFNAMRERGVRGLTIGPDGSMVITE
jgi:site-specific DNA recombinase